MLICSWRGSMADSPRSYIPMPMVLDLALQMAVMSYQKTVLACSFVFIQAPVAYQFPPNKFLQKDFFICLPLHKWEKLILWIQETISSNTRDMLTSESKRPSMGLNTIQVNVSEVPIKIKIGLFPWTICSAILYIHCIQRESVTRKNMAFYYLRCC